MPDYEATYSEAFLASFAVLYVVLFVLCLVFSGPRGRRLRVAIRFASFCLLCGILGGLAGAVLDVAAVLQAIGEEQAQPEVRWTAFTLTAGLLAGAFLQVVAWMRRKSAREVPPER